MHTQPLPTLKRARPNLFPCLTVPGDGAGGIIVPGVLAAGVVLQEPDGLRQITAEDLQQWRLHLAQALDIASGNLSRASSPAAWKPLLSTPGLMSYQARDGCGASRALILPTLLHPWPMEGVLAFVPTPDQLIIAPLQDAQAMRAFRMMISASHTAYRSGRVPLSDQLFWIHDGRWNHIQVDHSGSDVQVGAPEPFLRGIKRLMALDMYRAVAEA